MEYEIRDVTKAEIAVIKPVWECLNAIHLRDSVFFKGHYRAFTFEKRLEGLLKHEDDDLKITVVSGVGAALGYCLSTISGDSGEIESLCLLEELRGGGFGRMLVESHVAWMRDRKCARIRVSVSHGHESVLGFYEKLGFRPRLTVLEFLPPEK
jgi:diamine N-acetyltransferase